MTHFSLLYWRLAMMISLMSDRFDSSNFFFFFFFFPSKCLVSTSYACSIELFQAAVYGLGVCAEFGGPVFKPLVGGIFYLYIGKIISSIWFLTMTFLSFIRGTFKAKCCNSAS